MLIVEPIKRRSFDEEALLVEDAKANPGGDSELRLLNQFTPSIYSIAREFFDYNGKPKIESLPTPDDVFQFAYDAFRKAIQDYDPSLGNRFHTVLQKYVRQDLLNQKKEERTKGRTDSIEVYNPEKDKMVDVPVAPVSLETPVGGDESGGEPRMLVDAISDAITSRPDWQLHWKTLVEDVEKELNSEKKREVFRKLLEHGLALPGSGVKRLQNIREELGLKPSELSNILGRDIYPTVMKVLKLNDK